MSKTIFSPSNGLAKVILVCVVIIGGFLFTLNALKTTEALRIREARAADMPSVIITEVVPNGSPDWAELYCVSGPIDISGYVLTDMDGTDTSLATSSATLQAGDYAVVYWQDGTDETDATGDTNGNGYFDLYVSDTSLSATDDQLVLDSDDDVSNGAVDAVVWTDNDGSMVASEVSDGNNLVSYDQWTGTFATNDQSPAVILGESSQSIGRTSLTTDTNSKNDWQIFTTQTPGEANKESSLPTIESASATPTSVPADGKTEVTFSAEVTDEDNDVESVIIDLSPIGGEEEQEMSKGSGDIYSYTTTVSVGTEAKSYTLTITARDLQERDEYPTAMVDLTVTAPEYSDKVIINEFLPSPETDWNKDKEADKYDEWIELYNKGSFDIDLENWVIGDSTTQKYTIKDLSIKAGQYSVIYRSDYKLALNDTGGDCVKLHHPNKDEPLDSVCYTEKAEKDMAYALNKEGKWAWTTTPTPEKENIITSAEEDEEKGEEEKDEEENDKDEEKKDEEEAEEEVEEGKSKEHPKELSISDVKGEEKGTWVKVKGIVTCPPGVLSGSVIFYIQDGKTGIKIYSSKEDLPEIKLGDEIEVTGKTSEAQGEKKINIQDSEDVTIVSHKDLISAKSVKTGEIGEEYEGLLVIISGKVVSLHGSTFYVDDGSGRIKVSIKKSTGIDKPEMKKEDEVTIIGIVSEAYEAYRILPRFQEDIKSGKVKGVESEGKEEKLAKTGTSFWVMISISCLLASLFWLYYKKKIQLI